MFKKVHFRLTMLFTVITSMIMTVMSIFYLYTSHQRLYDNAFLNFQKDINALTISFEKNSYVSYDWLLTIQNNYDYLFYVYDNGYPLRFTNDTKNESEKQLIENIHKFYLNHAAPAESSYTSNHQEFLYKENHERFHVSIITIPGDKSTSEIFVVNPLREIESQMQTLYLIFGIVIIVSFTLLFSFSWFFTKKLLKPIQESQDKQTQFIAAASHEIRNPVNTILSALSAMEKGTDEQKREFASIAQKESRRLSKLTSDLLTLARSDKHTFIIRSSRTELDTIILECYEAFTVMAKEKNIKLTVKLPDKAIISNNMDCDRVRQVIAILLDNAVSYTPEGGNILLECEENSKSYSIKVADNGIGIPDEIKEKIFDRFYRADDSRTSTSHFGLGLCIAKEIVELHNGTITISNTKGGGTTLTIKLPK